MKIDKIGYCYCCNKFGLLHEHYDKHLCDECHKDLNLCKNLVTNILRKEDFIDANGRTKTVSY